MKKLLTISVSILFISLFLGSCTTKKQHCDAYGKIVTVTLENNSSEINTQHTIQNKEV